MCDNFDEMIESLNDIFSKGNAQVEEKDGEYFMEFKLTDFKKKDV